VPRAATHVKHHAHVPPVRPHVVEAVQQLDAVLGVAGVARADLRQQLDLVARRLRVVLGALLHLQVGGPRVGAWAWATHVQALARVQHPGAQRPSLLPPSPHLPLRLPHWSLTFMAPYAPVSLCTTSQTVEKWPHPSLRSTV